MICHIRGLPIKYHLENKFLKDSKIKSNSVRAVSQVAEVKKI